MEYIVLECHQIPHLEAAPLNHGACQPEDDQYGQVHQKEEDGLGEHHQAEHPLGVPGVGLVGLGKTGLLVGVIIKGADDPDAHKVFLGDAVQLV